ncbi:MAG: phosphatidate cytidylyltransferase [Lachnospiraceae bacterium]|nr:phosphatidate cytidylyltransferase [Lachnospiraceae bacterium]MDD5852558.1 phosphatidate cytidylyltransferase [Lachnospiraceae bacterium]
MFKTRLISSVALVIIIGGALILGGPCLFLFTLAISAIAFFEMTKAMRVRGEKKGPCLIEWLGLLGVVGYYLIIYFANTETFVMLTITLTIVSILFVYVFTFPKYEAKQVMATVFSFIYAPIMLSYLYMTRCLKYGFYIVWLIFISSWICDTCAYLVGMAIGKHKLAPVLSPKKSIEGAVGGVVGSAIVGLIYALILTHVDPDIENMLWVFPVICAVGAMISQVGDLAASAIKRNYDIKDYGKLIPGHGGIMDRFDSVIFTSPMIYYMAVLLLK